MKTRFAENIKTLRKAQHLTQEQLAEAMGVTAGAIYKWEQELSTPDISIIMELASFFGVCVDALVGYEVCSSDKERILQALKRFKLEKDYQNCWEEVEGWLCRYPNDFDIVYHSGILYNLVGIETKDNARAARSVELLDHACSLIGQNKDPEISETSISRDIAIAYLQMGKEQEGLDRLKSHNPCGINDDIIGQELATVPGRRKESLPYLSDALVRCTSSLYRVVIGFLNLFFERKDYGSAIGILRWMSGYLDGLRTEKGPSYLDKDNALLLAICGAVYVKIGEEDAAKEYLRKAYRIALKFDAAPDYTNRNIRYCEKQEPRVAYDNIGSSAVDTILNFLQEGIEDTEESALRLWEEICHENETAAGIYRSILSQQ